MKKILILFCILVFAAAMSSAQSLIFKRTSPAMVTGDTSYMYPLISRAILKNTSSTSQNFKVARIFIPGFPSSWTFSICCKAGCFSEELDTIPPNAVYYTLGPNETDSSFSIDLFGTQYGTGKVILRAFLVSNPSVYQQDTFAFRLQSSIGIQPISSIAENYELKQNYPNPFNPSTSIEFSLPKNTKVSLKVYNIHGTEVANLLNDAELQGGSYKYDFNSSEYNLTSGVYFCRLNAGDYVSTMKMLLIK
jgi:hypothetical protein